MDGISPKIESVLSNGFSSAFDISIHKLVTTFFTPQLTHINNIDNNMQNSHIHSSLLRSVHIAEIYHSMDHGYVLADGLCRSVGPSLLRSPTSPEPLTDSGSELPA